MKNKIIKANIYEIDAGWRNWFYLEIISKNGSLITSKSFIINFYKILQKFGYLIFNQKNFFLSVKIIIINFMIIFNQFIKR